VSHTDDRTITFPDATDTLVGKATGDVFTNKTLDCDGTGNVVTNVNADELDPTALTTALYAIPFIIPVVNSGSADINVFGGNCPFKLRVIDIWAANTKAGNAGNWKLQDGAAVDITSAVGYGAVSVFPLNVCVADLYAIISVSPGSSKLIALAAAGSAHVNV